MITGKLHHNTTLKERRALDGWLFTWDWMKMLHGDVRSDGEGDRYG